MASFTTRSFKKTLGRTEQDRAVAVQRAWMVIRHTWRRVAQDYSGNLRGTGEVKKSHYSLLK
jgi:hypothetical protein